MRAVRAWSRPQQAVAAVALVLAAGFATAWLAWPAKQTPPAPREREYKAATACLLTDDKGITGPTAAAAWAGMQEASTDSHVKVQYLAIVGPQTPANGLSYYNGLAVQNCSVIIAAGEVPAAAMKLGYEKFPKIRHAAIGDVSGTAKVTTVDDRSPDSIRAGVHELVNGAG